MNAHIHYMPVISTPFGLFIIAAFAPVLAAASTAATPDQIDAYTMIGATMAMFLSMAYLWVRAPHLVRTANVMFTAAASITVGALLPEPLAWGFVRLGWLADGTVEMFPRRLWGLLALACGLSGTTIVLVAIHWAQSRIPTLLLRGDDEEVARVRFDSGSEIEIKKLTDHTHPPKTP